MGTAPSATELIFLSTLSLRRATGRLAGYDAGNQNFYPRSPCGERQLERRYLRLCSDYFYPRSPCGERHEWDRFLQIGHYFYPRSPCGERPPRLARVVPTPIFLSTLSLRRATWACLSQSMTCVFLSTLSLRRATKPMEVPQYQILISIHALLAESDPLADGAEPHATISIHALLAESDQYWATRARAAQLFLSTLSLRRATYFCGQTL